MALPEDAESSQVCGLILQQTSIIRKSRYCYYMPSLAPFHVSHLDVCTSDTIHMHLRLANVQTSYHILCVSISDFAPKRNPPETLEKHDYSQRDFLIASKRKHCLLLKQPKAIACIVVRCPELQPPPHLLSRVQEGWKIVVAVPTHRHMERVTSKR